VITSAVAIGDDEKADDYTKEWLARARAKAELQE